MAKDNSLDSILSTIRIKYALRRSYYKRPEFGGTTFLVVLLSIAVVESLCFCFDVVFGFF